MLDQLMSTISKSNTYLCLASFEEWLNCWTELKTQKLELSFTIPAKTESRFKDDTTIKH
jgi:hypothetical protein